MVLILLMIMHLVSKRRGWSIFNIFRTALVFSIGLGLSLVALIGTNTNLTIEFLSSPWQLPTITICYLFVLILTHLPHPPRVFIKKSEKAESDMEMGRLSGREIPMEEAERAEPRVAEPPAAEPRAAEPKMTRTMTLKRGLTTMQRTARNIRIEPGRYDPVAEDELFFERRSPISGPNLHRV